MTQRNNIYVIGAGLYGCLTAWKIKKKNPEKNVRLVDSSDHIISVFDPISIDGIEINNGFHGIELPRAQGLFDFIKKELELDLEVEKNIKKMIIDGCVVDYTDKLSQYPSKIKNFFYNQELPINTTPSNLLDLLPDDFRVILKKISSRYSDDFDSALHLLIPWFCPADFIINSQDEGDIFRNCVRLREIDPLYAWPSSYLFQEIQPAFEKALKKIGVEMLLSTKVDFSDNGIRLHSNDESSPKIELDIDTVFLCMPPVGILRHVSEKIFLDLVAKPRDLYNILLGGSFIDECIPFTEVLCCDPEVVPLSRISRHRVKNSTKTFLQLELFAPPHKNIDHDFTDKLLEYINRIMPSLGYKDFSLIGLRQTRKVYFPNKQVTDAALSAVRSWSNRFQNIKTLESFAPINMAKTWSYSEMNQDFIYQ
jgi:hypothetical protein